MILKNIIMIYIKYNVFIIIILIKKKKRTAPSWLIDSTTRFLPSGAITMYIEKKIQGVADRPFVSLKYVLGEPLADAFIY